jgi:hypothetical protein
VGRYNDPTKLKYGDLSNAETSIESAYQATLVYLDDLAS